MEHGEPFVIACLVLLHEGYRCGDSDRRDDYQDIYYPPEVWRRREETARNGPAVVKSKSFRGRFALDMSAAVASLIC